MAVVNRYRLRCTTDNKYEHVWANAADAAPTLCPTDTAHTVDTAQTSIVETAGDEAVKNEAGVLLTSPQVQTIGLQMCDRDILIKTAIFDARAALTVPGVDANGDVTYSAKFPGQQGNLVAVTHEVGATGAGNESRALAVVVTHGLAPTVVVTFGTDGVGDSVVPDANALKALLDADADLARHATVAVGGTGASGVGAIASTVLAGGVTSSLEDLKVDPATNLRSEWLELTQVGCFKLDGGAYVQVASQAEADTDAVLSVWSYRGVHQSTGLPQIVELRDGHLIVDAATSDNLAHQGYAIAAPSIPAAYGGSITQFDAYLKYFAGKELGATSPQAKALDPNGPGGFAGGELRVYIYYPAGEKLNHVLRLVTYRAAGTF